MTPWSRLLSWIDRGRNARPSPGPALPRIVFPGSDGAPFPLLQQLVDAFGGASPPPVLVFGDSVMERVSRNDGDQRPLGAMIAQSRVEPTCVLTRSAFQPSLALGLLRVLRRLQPPQVVVLPVNLRCFSPQWDINPAWSFHRELAAIDAWLADDRRPPLPIPDVREPDDFYAGFDHIPVETPLSERDSVGAFRAIVRDRSPELEAVRRREILVFHYGIPLSPVHRKLLDLRACLMLLREVGATPVVYVTPVNVETCRRTAGEDLTAMIAANVATIGAAGRASGANVVDFSDALGGDMFFHEDFATEHLNEAGRTRLAANIAGLIDGALKSRA